MSSEAERAAGLGEALAERGLALRVEPAGSLAIVVPVSDAPIDWSVERREVVRLAASHGFSHVALELPDAGAGRHPSTGQGGA